MKVVAAADHEIPTRPAIDVGERDTTWPAFVFVSTTSGSGWVPERHLDDSRPTARVLRGYNTLELPVDTGDELTVLEDDPDSGWSWCANSAGRVGWVPHSALQQPS